MSRIGKIARLPKAVREELNRRLEDGEQQNRLVEWLNGHPDVQAMLKAHYDGRPINEPNLTAWVQGGYEDWRRQEESRAAAERLTEECAALGAITGDRGLVDRVAMTAALAIGEQLMAVRRMEDGDEKRRAVLKLVRGLVRLRKSDRECERGQREAAQAARAAELHEDWAVRMRRRSPAADVAPSTGLRANATFGADTDVRKKMAEVIVGMSDEEIAESLRLSGRLGPAPVRPGSGQTENLEPAKQIWWTEEDQALEGDNDEDEGEDGEEGEDKEEGEEEERAAPTKSTCTSMSTSVDAPVRHGSGQTQRLEAEGPSIVPPEGGTTNHEPAGGGLTEA